MGLSDSASGSELTDVLTQKHQFEMEQPTCLQNINKLNLRKKNPTPHFIDIYKNLFSNKGRFIITAHSTYILPFLYFVLYFFLILLFSGIYLNFPKCN